MTIFKLIIRSLLHYKKLNIAVSSGIAVAAAVICGALIIGDSIDKSLLNIVEYRLGRTTHTITAGDRVFTQTPAVKMNNIEGISAAPSLMTTGELVEQNSNNRLNNVNVYGVDSLFDGIYKNNNAVKLNSGEIALSKNIADRLDVEEGDFLLLRMNTKGAIPYNTPFVAEDDKTVSRRVIVKFIAPEKGYGNFNLNISQSSPFNVFVNIDWLNGVMEMENKSNLLLISASSEISSCGILSYFKESFTIEDIGLNAENKENYYRITSDRVFIEEQISDAFNIAFDDFSTEYALTYFVNSISLNDISTPYSFVSAVENKVFDLHENQTIINEWLASDLSAEVGDTITLKYYTFGHFRELTENEVELIVAGIIPMYESQKHINLMPDLPGLTDVGNCRDWEAGIPIDLELIRDKDEKYWDDFKGTPKAFIALELGQKLWENRFGNLTTVFVSKESLYNDEFTELITKAVNPFQIEFRINEVKKDGIFAAEHGENFTQLFAGLSMFIVFSGIILTILLINLSIKNRADQISIYSYIGFSKKMINKIFLYELFVLVVIGSLAGLLLSFLYSKLIFYAINDFWFDIVRTEVLVLHFSLSTVSYGLILSIIISLFVVWRGLVSSVKRLSGKTLKTEKHYDFFFYSSSVVFLLIAFTIIIRNLIISDFSSIMLWYISGIALLVGIVLLSYKIIKNYSFARIKKININSLTKRNLSANPLRSISIVSLLAIGSFIIVLTSVNRQDMFIDYTDKKGGTGGFLYLIETGLPVLENLNNADVKQKYQLREGLSFVQFISAYNDDASCLNLNRVANPRIIAVSPEKLKNRFSFLSLHKDFYDEEDPWQSLNAEMSDVIPGIADKTVIRWGLGKNVGDTLKYFNSAGDEINIMLVGGIDNSIFQGNIIISDEHFKRNFPMNSGADFILVDYKGTDYDGIAEELGFALQDKGAVINRTDKVLAEFNSIENTYLRIFFILGAFGFLIGTVGLAVVLAKNIIERKKEFALMLAIGYSKSLILKIIFGEYLGLLIFGIFAGVFTALIATFPGIYFSGSIKTLIDLLIVITILLLNGFIWISIITNTMLRGITPAKGLTEE